MMFEFPPRCYQDVTVPAPEVADHFPAYVEWLADHLFEKEFPLPTRLKAGDWTLRSLAIDYAYGGNDLEHVAACARQGMTHEEFMRQQMQLWREMDDGLEEYLPNYMLDAEIYARIQEEERERAAVCPNLESSDETLDMPFRPLLARELKKIASRAARVDALKEFFRLYQEEVRK